MTTIPDHQRRIHVATEAMSVLLIAPFTAALTFNRRVPAWARAGLGIVTIGILVVDGWLLTQWKKL